MITFESLKKNEALLTYIEQADLSLKALGYTEHSLAHVTKVSETAKYILKTLNFPARDIELAQIAAFLHDIGNLVNRVAHSQSSAIMAFRLLSEMGMDAKDIALIATAIGNHDEGTGVAVNPIAAALILADKTDVRRSRVRNTDFKTFDIHDRVNYSVKESRLVVSPEEKTLTVFLTIDTEVGSVMDYFEIFMGRMIMCRKAAETLGLTFKLFMNEQQIV